MPDLNRPGWWSRRSGPSNSPSWMRPGLPWICVSRSSRTTSKGPGQGPQPAASGRFPIVPCGHSRDLLLGIAAGMALRPWLLDAAGHQAARPPSRAGSPRPSRPPTLDSDPAPATPAPAPARKGAVEPWPTPPPAHPRLAGPDPRPAAPGRNGTLAGGDPFAAGCGPGAFLEPRPPAPRLRGGREGGADLRGRESETGCPSGRPHEARLQCRVVSRRQPPGHGQRRCDRTALDGLGCSRAGPARSFRHDLVRALEPRRVAPRLGQQRQVGAGLDHRQERWNGCWSIPPPWWRWRGVPMGNSLLRGRQTSPRSGASTARRGQF